VNSSSEDVEAEEEYNDMYYSLDVDDVSSSDESSQGFEEPLQITDSESNRTSLGDDKVRDTSALEGDNESKDSLESLDHPELTQSSETEQSEVEERAKSTACATYHAKPALNRNTRRRLAREIEAKNYHVHRSSGVGSDKALIELRKHMARPPGCSFLGSTPTEAEATVGGLNIDLIRVIIDSGSDITLISQKALDNLLHPPKIKAGQNIKLVQVTGKSSLTGFVTLDLYFHTDEGPVKLNVEAYVVKGMTAPFILGNDFADQYSISVIRENGDAHLQFGNSGRQLKVATSTSSPFIDEDGHAFKIKVFPGIAQHGPKAQIHRRNQKLNRKARLRQQNSEVWATKRVVIPPETSCAVPIQMSIPLGQNSVLVERNFGAHGNTDQVYGSPDSLVSRDKRFLGLG
jgi:hypothetical protein